MALTKITTSVVAANTLATANIADNSVDATKIASNSILTRHIDDDQITGDQLADNITIAGNLTITGNLTTNGSTVTNSSSNTTIEDAIIELGTGTSGAPATDAGIVIERGSSDNVFIGWDESADKVTVGTGSFTGASTGNLTITAAPFVSGALTASGISYPTSDGSAGQYLKTDGSGALSFGAVTTQVDNYTATGDGSTTAFDTGINPHNEVNTWIFIDGVYQQKSQYSYSGSTVTFSTAPENGALIDVVTGTTGGMASSDTVLGIYEATTTNTATYTTGISASNENNTWVFVGGVYQPKDSYTFSSGTLTFDANTPTGQKLSVVATKALTAGSVETTSLGANAVTAVKIASNSILSRHIANNSIVGADISATTGITAATFTAALTGNVTGNVAGNLTGTILTAAQTNITSVGTLSALTVSGQLTAGGIAYPTSDGSADQVLKTDGSGALSFGTVSGTTINNNTNNYVMTGTGSANTLNGEANLTFDSSLVITKSEGAANSLNDQISLEHTSGTTGYHIKTIRAASTDNPDGIAFVENTTERMRIRGGNVAIGTDSPFSPLHVSKTDWSSGSPYGTVATIEGNNVNDNNWGHLIITDTTTSNGNGGSIRFASGSTSSLNPFAGIQGVAEGTSHGGVGIYTRPSGGTATERMRIDSSGRVGIGTDNPGVGYGGAITAAKVAILSGAAGSNGGSSTLLIGGDDKHYAYMQGTHTSSGNTQLDFGTANGANNPTQRATLNEWGAWKVKSTSGAYFSITSKYHEINSNDGALTTVLIRNGSTYYASCVNFWLYGGAPNNTQSNFWTCNDTVGQKASLQSNGGFYNYQSNNSNLCDEREKKNIEVLGSTWNSVKSWDLKKFHYNEDADSDDKRLGVIAQEIETTNPELITAHTRVQAKDAVLWTEEDDLPEGVSIGDIKTAAQDAVVRKGVKEQQMYIMAIKALQEAMTEIESLKARIETLEG